LLVSLSKDQEYNSFSHGIKPRIFLFLGFIPLLRKLGGYSVCIVGAGMIANSHVRAWRDLANVVAIVDVIPEKARGFAEGNKIDRWYTSVNEALEKCEFDIVDVCTPTFTHCEIAVEAMNNGKHVLCEKPIALTLEDADKMIKASEKNKVKFMVAHCLRFWNEYRIVKESIDRGEIGEPRIARAYRYISFPLWGGWQREMEKSGGVLIDMGIHDLDYLRWIIGEVKEVYANGGILKSKGTDAHDYLHVLLKFEGEAIAFVESSWIHPKSHPFTYGLEVVGERGMLKFSRETSEVVQLWTEGGGETISPLKRDAISLEIEHFLNCIESGEEPLVTGLEARKSLEVALAAIRSVEEGRPVRLPLNGGSI